MSSIRTDIAVSPCEALAAHRAHRTRHHRPLTPLLPLLALLLPLPPTPATAQDTPPALPVIELVTDATGTRLQVDGADMMVQGVNWDYFPRGTTYNYNFWTEPDHVIEAALDREMSLLKAMGGNAIRTYVGITPRWVRHIHERYGIYTILNHALGRYGVTAGGVYYEPTRTTRTPAPAPCSWPRSRRW